MGLAVACLPKIPHDCALDRPFPALNEGKREEPWHDQEKAEPADNKAVLGGRREGRACVAGKSAPRVYPEGSSVPRRRARLRVTLWHATAVDQGEAR